MKEATKLIRIEDDYKERLDRTFARDLERTSRWSNWAGDLGWPCDPYQVLCRMKGHLRPPYTIGLKKVFRVGVEWEDPNYRLIKSAYPPIKILDKIGKFKWDEKKISGRVDFRIEIEHPKNGDKIKIPFEHKTCSPTAFNSIFSHKLKGESLTKSRYPWVKKYPGQLTAYNLMDESEYGMYFFFQKVSGDYFFWLVPLDYEYGEQLLQRADRVNEFVADKFIPKSEYKDICPVCDYALTWCFPDRRFGPGFDLIESDELEAKVARFKELDQYVAERNALQKELVGDARKPGLFYGKNAVLSRHIITSKEIERKGYEVKPGSYWRTDIRELPEGDKDKKKKGE